MALILQHWLHVLLRDQTVRNTLFALLEEVLRDDTHESVSIAHVRRLRAASPLLETTLAWDPMAWYYTIMEHRRRCAPDLSTIVGHRDVRKVLLKLLEPLYRVRQHESVTIAYMRQIRLCSRAMEHAMQFDPWLWTLTVGRNRLHLMELQSIVQELSDDVLRSEQTLLPMPTWFCRHRLMEEFQRQHRAYVLRNVTSRREAGEHAVRMLCAPTEEDAESDSSVASHPGL